MAVHAASINAFLIVAPSMRGIAAAARGMGVGRIASDWCIIGVELSFPIKVVATNGDRIS